MRLYTNYLVGSRTISEFGGDNSFITKINPRYNENNTKKYSKVSWLPNISIWMDKSQSSLKVVLAEKNEDYEDYEDEEYNYYLDGTISNFYGNCGICSISTPGLDGNDDLEKEFFQFLIDLCLQMGYTQVLYSVSTRQDYTIEIIKQAGFKPFKESEVDNKRSGNTIQIYYLNIR